MSTKIWLPYMKMNIHYVEKWMSIMLRQIPREASLILFPPSAVTSFSAKFYGCPASEHFKSPLFWELNLFRQFRRSSVFVWQRLVIKKGWWLRVQTWQMLLPKGSWNVRRTIDTVWASPPTWLLNMSGHQAAQSGTWAPLCFFFFIWVTKILYWVRIHDI